MREIYKKWVNNNHLPGVPGRLLLLLAGFELGFGLGGWTWTWWTKEVALMVELGGTEKVSSDIIFEEKKKSCVLN